MKWGEICQQWHLLEAFVVELVIVDLRVALLLPLILVAAGFFLLLLSP